MCVYIHTTKNHWHKDVVGWQTYNCVWYFCIYLYVLSFNGWHALFCMTNNRHDVTMTKYAIKCDFLIWMTTVRQPTKRRCSCVLILKYAFVCVYLWTRQRIHYTLIVVDRYLRFMGAKTIPDSAEPRLESFIFHSSQVSIYHIKVWCILIVCIMEIPMPRNRSSHWKHDKLFCS